MRSLQLQEAAWGSLCVQQQLRGIRRLRRKGKAHAPGAALDAAAATGSDSPAGPEPGSRPPRGLPCPPPPPLPLPLPLPAPRGGYGAPPAAAPSPRTRPAEPPAAAAAAAEIKALQQTRRLLANARERTRVHTISAAFEALRKQVPCYSYGQKLSKLAILRIACNYILSLARLADLDYSADHSNMSFSECVEQCTRTLQAEGRSKKRKE
ncbi:transcription factor ATOH8 [Alligator mississippiensis]|uniref:transcription factor ATOH8 n=1 Tax=Alligator mississippiensis TaxID=8496 RepID=UPI0028778874|nr:transcription factor ATOH8 [Alligator mississippiensis]